MRTFDSCLSMPTSSTIEEALMGLVLEAYRTPRVRDNLGTPGLIRQLAKTWATLQGWFEEPDLRPRNDLLYDDQERRALFNTVYREQAELPEDADAYPVWFPYAALPAWLIEGAAVIAAEHR